MVMMFFHRIDTCPLETGLKPADSSCDFQPLQCWAVFKSVTQNEKLSRPLPKCTGSLNIFNSSTLIKIASLKNVFKGPGVLASDAFYVGQRVLVLQD